MENNNVMYTKLKDLKVPKFSKKKLLPFLDNTLGEVLGMNLMELAMYNASKLELYYNGYSELEKIFKYYDRIFNIDVFAFTKHYEIKYVYQRDKYEKLYDYVRPFVIYNLTVERPDIYKDGKILYPYNLINGIDMYYNKYDRTFKTTSKYASSSGIVNSVCQLKAVTKYDIMLLEKAVKKAKLNDRETYIIEKYYKEYMSIADIGRAIGVTGSRTAQLRTLACRKKIYKTLKGILASEKERETNKWVDGWTEIDLCNPLKKLEILSTPLKALSFTRVPDKLMDYFRIQDIDDPIVLDLYLLSYDKFIKSRGVSNKIADSIAEYISNNLLFDMAMYDHDVMNRYGEIQISLMRQCIDIRKHKESKTALWTINVRLRDISVAMYNSNNHLIMQGY